MLQARLLRTPTLRLALLSAALFALSSALILTFFYVATARFEENRLSELIRGDLDGLVQVYKRFGPDGLRRAVERRSRARSDRAGIWLLVGADGSILAGNLDQWPSVEPDANGWLNFEIETFDPRGEPTAHSARARAFVLPNGGHLMVGRDVQDIERFRARVVRAVLWALLPTLVLSVVGGVLVSQRLVARVETVNRATERIIAGELGERIPRAGERDEFDRLAANLNVMLDRIERLIEERTQITDDIAHDLRTPLTRLRNRLELALLEDLDAGRGRALLEDTLAEVDGVIATFNALLDIAQAERGSEMAPVDLSATLAETCELYRPVAEERGLQLDAAIAPALSVRGNRHRLAQAFANLLDNAVKYARTNVRVVAANGASGPSIMVADDGPGIPEVERETALRRFARLERDRSKPGNGLGLSLVKAVADVHQARLRLDDNRPGLSVGMDFPAAA